MLRRRPQSPLEDALGHRFRDPSLLELALIHRSYAYEQAEEGEVPEHNERLEFLGDTVLGMVAAEWLYRRFPELPEGELSKLRASLVNTRALAGYGALLGVGNEIRLGVGEERSGGRSKKSLLADATEALFGAVYLDGGLEAVRRVIEPLLEETFAERPRGGRRDAKTTLQEAVQALGWRLPEYRLVEESGPDHAKRFTVECSVGGRVVGEGSGSSKKAAEQQAASATLDWLEDQERRQRKDRGTKVQDSQGD